MKTLLTLLISMSILSSCKTDPATNTQDFSTPKTLKNVSYGKDSLQNMDIYLPAGRNSDITKAIVLIHGGGWNGGSKAEFDPYIDTLKTRMPDYAIFNLGYRLVNNQNLFPTQELDIKAALDHITAHAVPYGINKEKIAVLGFSAGAHLALLQAYKYNHPSIKAVVDFFGPTDLVTMYNRPWHPLVPYALQMVTGTTPKSNPEIYKTSSPVNYVKTTSPPTLIIHGVKDQVVDISQSKLLKNKLAAEGVIHELVEYPGLGHGWYGANMTNSFNRVEIFLKAHL
jgi:acetyl esterase/lipase